MRARHGWFCRAMCIVALGPSPFGDLRVRMYICYDRRLVLMSEIPLLHLYIIIGVYGGELVS